MTERSQFAAILKSAKFANIGFTNGNHFGSLAEISPIWLKDLAASETPSDDLHGLKADLEDMLDKVNDVLALLETKMRLPPA